MGAAARGEGREGPALPQPLLLPRPRGTEAWVPWARPRGVLAVMPEWRGCACIPVCRGRGAVPPLNSSPSPSWKPVLCRSLFLSHFRAPCSTCLCQNCQSQLLGREERASIPARSWLRMLGQRAALAGQSCVCPLAELWLAATVPSAEQEQGLGSALPCVLPQVETAPSN